MPPSLLEQELAPDPAQSLEYCLRILEKSPQDAFLPYRYFSILRDILGFSAGVLLLVRGKERRLIPAAALCLENASIQKLRFNLSELSMQAELRTEFAVLSAEHSFLANRLSLNDRGKYSSFLYIKLGQQDSVEGLLLLAGSPYAALSTEELVILFSGIRSSFGRSLATIAHTNYSQPLLSTVPRTKGISIRIGDLARLLSHEFLGALHGSVELDLLGRIGTYLASYKTAYVATAHLLQVLVNLDQKRAKYLLSALQDRICRDFSLDPKQFDLSSFFVTENG